MQQDQYNTACNMGLPGTMSGSDGVVYMQLATKFSRALQTYNIGDLYLSTLF